MTTEASFEEPSQVVPAERKLCRFCAEELKSAATLCRFCGRDQSHEEDTLGNSAVHNRQLFEAIAAEDFGLAIGALPQPQQMVYQAEVDRRRRNTGIAYLFYALLGAFGGHKYYIGEYAWGNAYLLTSLTMMSGQFGTLVTLLGVNNRSPIEWLAAIGGGLSTYLILGASLGTCLFFDLFLMPRQVSRANNRIRWMILEEIARHLSPTVALPSNHSNRQAPKLAIMMRAVAGVVFILNARTSAFSLLTNHWPATTQRTPSQKQLELGSLYSGENTVERQVAREQNLVADTENANPT